MQILSSNSIATTRVRQTPIGIEFLAALTALAGVLFVIAGLAFLVSGPRDIGTNIQPSGNTVAWIGVDAAAGVIFLIFGILHEVLALGLIRLVNVARILSILLFGMSATGACLGFAATIVRFSFTGLAWNIAVAVADAGALWYLLRPRVKEAFRA